AAKRRRWRLWRSPPTRSRFACPRYSRGICLGSRGDEGLRRVSGVALPSSGLPPTRKSVMGFSSWRGVVRMINPTMRPGVTEEVIRLLPEGIGLIPLFLNIRRGTEDEFAAMMPAYEERIAQLAECGCDLIHPHGAPPFMVQGRKREAEIVRAWE